MIADSYGVVLAILIILFSLLFLSRSVWIRLYIQYIVQRALRHVKDKGLLQDREVSHSTLDDSQTDVYDEVSFLAVNVRKNCSLHVAITRKCDRKSYVLFTLDINGQTYRLPGPAVTYNNPYKGFSSAGLTLSVLEEGSRWRLTYSGPLRISEKDKTVDVKLMLLWKVHTRLIGCTNSSYTEELMVDFLSKCYAESRMSWREVNYALSQAMESSCRTTLQAGAFQGYMKVEKGEEIYLTLRGFKRRTNGEGNHRVGSISSMEHLMVSEKGHHQYMRLPMYSVGSIPDLSALCCLKMCPNGELAAADLQYVHPQLEEKVQTRCTYSTIDYPLDNHLGHYLLTDSRSRDRKCVLYPFSLQHRHYGTTQVDKGKGLLLLNNMQVVEGEDVTWQWLQYQDICTYKPSLSRPLLAPVHDMTPASDVSLLIALEHPSCSNSQLVGGKGSQLAILYQAELQNKYCVPTAVCLTIEAFHTQLRTYPQLLQLSLQLQTQDDVEQMKVLCQKLQQAILSSEVNRSTSEAIKCFLSADDSALCEQTRLAVRSSAIGEDGVDQSAAGQMDTVLGVKGYVQVLSAVLKCWASYYSFVAVQYKRQRGQAMNSGMAVVIQEMVKAEQAGAMFTHDPVNNSCTTMVLNASYGLGESVVSGESEPDTFHMTHSTDTSGHVTFSIREKRIGSKRVQYTVSDSGEVTKQTLIQSSELCISDDIVLQLCRIGLELEQGFGHPCDIEWAVRDGEIFLLQSRPITTLTLECEYELMHEFDSPLVMDHEMLSTMNIGEVIPEAVCPLTLTTILPKLEIGMQSLAFVKLRCSMQALLKISYNRIFINVHSLEIHKGKAIICNRRIMELALAGHTIDKMTDDEVKSYHPTSSLYSRIYSSWMFVCDLWTGLGRCLSHAETLNNCALPQTTDCMELMCHIEQALSIVEQMFIDDLPVASQSAVFSQIIMGVLTKGSEVWESKHLGDLASLLGCRLTNVFSAGVPERLEQLSLMIRDTPELADKFCDVTPSEGHDLLTDSNVVSSVRDAYLSFMNNFGHRGVGELDVMLKSWSQEPAVLIQTLQLMVRNSSTKHHIQAAPTQVDDVINSLQCNLSAIEKRIIRCLLPKTKVAINNRELCKSLLVKSVYKVKVAFWRLSELMHSQGYLPSPELLFFLTYSEICEVLRARSGALVTKAKRRMRVFHQQKVMKFARFSDGIPTPLVTDRAEAEVEVELTGMPVSVGEVTGVARVVTSLSLAHTIEKNEIMVVPYTDIGWAPFFPMICGLVTEQGGLVSHGAVVAREYGIPCVASCSSATNILNSGDVVCINGSTGLVRRLKSHVEHQQVSTS